MTFGLRCSRPACRPHPASLPVCVPAVESLPTASFSFASRLRLAVQLRLPSSAPIGSFHPIRFCPCWAHPAAVFQAACSGPRKLKVIFAEQTQFFLKLKKKKTHLPAVNPHPEQRLLALRRFHFVAFFR